MEDASPHVLANRDDPIPIFKVPTNEDDTAITSSSEVEDNVRRRDKLKIQATKAQIKVSQSLQDRVLSGLMAQIIPSEPPMDQPSSSDDETKPTLQDKKAAENAAKALERPGFSLQLMSTNFRRFNARIGVVFVLQAEIIKLLSWKHPTSTWSLLAIYSLLCLNPSLIPAVPLLGLVFFIMIPAFLTRHPSPKNDPRIEASLNGPPVAPAVKVKPAPEMSKDFFRNMRDLQNVMEDFSRGHDLVLEAFAPWTNFAGDETRSSALFLVLAVGSSVAVLTCRMVPWNLVALVVGWCAIGAGHPMMQETMLSEETIQMLLDWVRKTENVIKGWVDKEIILDEPPESRLVEVFELQKYHEYGDIWEPWLYSPAPYDPLSPSRLAGIRAKGTQFFEEVQAPTGWVWKDKKWALDLYSKEWVQQRMITGVEIEMEGERWVYDIPMDELEMTDSFKLKTMQTGQAAPKSGWQESQIAEPRGEWRRRRWVRRVQRRVVLTADGRIAG